MTEAFCQLLSDRGALDYFRSAAYKACEDLRLLDLLQTHTPLKALSSSLNLPSTHRLRALLNVMVHERWVERRDGSYCALELPDPHLVAQTVTGPWGALARVIRSDAPISPFDGLSGTSTAETFVRYQEQMAHWGRSSAAEMMRILTWPRGAHLLDVGGGLGIYSEAFLSADHEAQATILELPCAVAAGRARSARHADRRSWIEGSALDVDLPSHQFDVVLLSNVIHWYGPGDVQQLIGRAFDWTTPRGALWIKDMVLTPDRRGPESSLWFNLNMALVSDQGQVYTSLQVEAWIEHAGWNTPSPTTLSASPHSLVWTATKS